jgi:hypothetical protein
MVVLCLLWQSSVFRDRDPICWSRGTMATIPRMESSHVAFPNLPSELVSPFLLHFISLLHSTLLNNRCIEAYSFLLA